MYEIVDIIYGEVVVYREGASGASSTVLCIGSGSLCASRCWSDLTLWKSTLSERVWE